MAQFPSDTVGYGVWSLSEIRNAVRGGNWPTSQQVPVVELDPYFNQTVLLLAGDGTSGAQNNTFLDSSANSFTITRNGNTTQGSYSPYGDRWSNYFDGTGNHISVASSAEFAYGTSDFTLEFWIYLGSHKDFTIFLDQRTTFNLAVPHIYSDNTGFIKYFVSGADRIVSNNALPLNQWHHIAVSRSGTSTNLFIDGVQQGSSWTDTTSYVQGGELRIGRHYSNTAYNVDGYMSDVRIVKGTALYTSNFTPPTEPLTAVTNTSLLTCQSNRFIDNSSNGFAITVNGDTKVTPFSPYAPSDAYDPANEGGSGYFDGTGDYLAFPTIDIATSQDFCAEAWVYLTAYDAQFTEVFAGPDVGPGASDADNTQFRIAPNGDILFAIFRTAVFTATNAYPGLNQWVHLAFVRNSNTCILYVNGQNVGSGTQSGAGKLTFIGETGNGATPIGYNINGYVSDARIVIGSPVYTFSFTPPTAPLPVVANTSFLCNFDNAGIFDSTGKNVLETVGNAQIDTAVTKFGTGSMEFDGTGDYLVMENSGSLNLAGLPWTIEAWLNPSSNFSTARIVFAKRLSGSSTLSYQGYLDVSTGNIGFSNGSSTYVSSSAPTANTWNHCAWVYDGANINIYLNGTSVLSSATTITEVDTELVIGAIRGFSSGAYLGYIDDFRITKGVARYTANFTPPAKAFPVQ